MYFIQTGVIDVYQSFENNEFIIEKLYRGSIINYRTFFLPDEAFVYLRVAEDAIIQEFEFSKMELLS